MPKLHQTAPKPKEVKPPLLMQKQLEPYKNLVEGLVFPHLTRSAAFSVRIATTNSSTKISTPAKKLDKADFAMDPVIIILKSLIPAFVSFILTGLSYEFGASEIAANITFFGVLSASITGLVLHTAKRLREFIEGLKELREQGRL